MDEITFKSIIARVIRFRYTFAFLFFATIGLGVAIATLSKEVFQIKSSFEINFYPFDSTEICQNVSQLPNRVACLDGPKIRRLEAALGAGWTVSASRVASFNTDAPSSPASYMEALQDANDVLTQEVLESAQLDIGIVQNTQFEQVRVSEYATKSFLHASRIVSRIKSGEKLFTFDAVKVQKIYPRVKLVLLAAAFVGLILGLLGVAFRAMFNPN